MGILSVVVNIIFYSSPPFGDKVDFRVNPFMVFIQSLRHADKQRGVETIKNIILLVNAILKQKEINIAFETDRVNFNKKESASIYYGIMASAVKHNIGLDFKACIDSAAKSFLSGMLWKGFTDFKQECVTSWTKLFATNEVQFTDNAIDNFLAFVDHMSCSADTYVSLGGSNGCADQLTNWDGTQKVGLGAVLRKKTRGFSL